MLFDGIKLIGRATLPVSGSQGEMIYLLQQDGANSPGLYEHDGTSWKKGSGGAEVDLSSVSQDIIPDQDNVRSLGSPTKMWKDMYVGPGSLYVNGQKVLEESAGTIVLHADPDQNVQIKTEGTGDIEFLPNGTGSLQFKGNMQVQSGFNLTSSDGQPINCPVGFGDLTINNLTVNGTTTTVNTENVNIADNILTLNSNAVGTPTENAGITVNRGDANNASILWNESVDKWQFTADGVNFTDLGSGEGGGGEVVIPDSIIDVNTIDSAVPYAKLGVETLTTERHPETGKPFYTQAFKIDSIVAGDNDVTTNLLDVDFAVVDTFWFPSDTGWMASSSDDYYYNNDYKFTVGVAVDGSTIRLAMGTQQTSHHGNPAIIIIKYTKTNDDANTPVSGVIANVAKVDVSIPHFKVDEEVLTTKRHAVTGKPIYARAYHIPDMGTTYDGNLPLNITDLEDATLVDFEIKPISLGHTYSSTISYYINDASQFHIYVDNANGNIEYRISDNATMNNAEIIFYVEYTKSTDTSASPVAGVMVQTDGVKSSIPYPKVGTEILTAKRHPVSGKPVYTQTFTGSTGGGGTITKPTGLTGIELCSLVDWVIHGSNGTTYSQGSSWYETNSDKLYAQCDTNGVNVYLIIGTNFAGYLNATYEATIEYTKTDDTGSSPVATPVLEILSGDSEAPYAKVGEETLTTKRHPVTGKPVYTRAYTYTIAAHDDSMVTGLTDIEHISLVEYAFAPSGPFGDSSYRVISGTNNWYASDASENIVWVTPDGTAIYHRFGDNDNASYIGTDGYFVVEYTKASDTQSSPVKALVLNTTAVEEGIPYPKIGEETLTHKRHPVSGTPVYTRVYAIDMATNDLHVDPGLTGVDHAVIIDAVVESNNGVTYSSSYSYYASDASEWLVQINTDGSDIYVRIPDNAANWINKTVHVTIEYTKTADTISTPVAPILSNIVKGVNEGTAVAYMEDQKTLGSDGGAAPFLNNWFTRTLNTVVSDPENIVSLAGSSFTLQPGTYKINWEVPAYDVGGHVSSLFNSTDGIHVSRGSNGMSHATYPNTTLSSGEAIIEISSAKTFAIQHRVEKSASTANHGLGMTAFVATDYEVFTRVRVAKLIDTSIKQSGDTLQTAYVQAVEENHSTPSADTVLVSKVFTPKSNNSTILIEFSSSMCQVIAANDDMQTHIKKDGTDINSQSRLARLYGGAAVNIINDMAGMTSINNTSTAPITLEYYVKQRSGSARFTQHCSHGMKITEIQN